jgi:hypothetical protein
MRSNALLASSMFSYYTVLQISTVLKGKNPSVILTLVCNINIGMYYYYQEDTYRVNVRKIIMTDR